MKKRSGAIKTYAVLSLMITFSFVAIFFGYPIINSYFNISNIGEEIPIIISDKNGFERVYSELSENISLSEREVYYEDIDETYTIEENYIYFEDKNINTNNYVDIYNYTSLDISVYFIPVIDENNPVEPSYNLRILKNNEVIQSFNDINNSVNVNIPYNYIYNLNTGTTNYGRYSVETDVVGGYTLVEFKYREQVKREVLVSNSDNIKKVLTLNGVGAMSDPVIEIPSTPTLPDEWEYQEEYPEFETVENITTNWIPSGIHEINESGHYNEINIIQNRDLYIDTSEGDVYIFVDNFNFVQGSIIVQGDNRVLIFVDDSFSIGGSSKINKNGDSNNVLIFVNDGNINFEGAFYGRFGLHAPNSDVKLNGSAKIDGKIIANDIIKRGNGRYNEEPLNFNNLIFRP